MPALQPFSHGAPVSASPVERHPRPWNDAVELKADPDQVQKKPLPSLHEALHEAN